MKATVNGVEYVVGWRYDQQARSTDSHLCCGSSTCTIARADSREAPELTGTAWCSKKDQFIKAIGRKRSFEYAIARVPRGERSAWWAEFWKNFKQGAA